MFFLSITPVQIRITLITAIIGKRLLDYGEIHFDTFNKDTSGVLRAKLVFEEDYEIKIDGYNLLITEFVE